MFYMFYVIEDRRASFLNVSKQIVNSLIESPFHFCITVQEKKEMTERIAKLLTGN